MNGTPLNADLHLRMWILDEWTQPLSSTDAVSSPLFPATIRRLDANKSEQMANPSWGNSKFTAVATLENWWSPLFITIFTRGVGRLNTNSIQIIYKAPLEITPIYSASSAIYCRYRFLEHPQWKQPGKLGKFEGSQTSLFSSFCRFSCFHDRWVWLRKSLVSEQNHLSGTYINENG